MNKIEEQQVESAEKIRAIEIAIGSNNPIKIQAAKNALSDEGMEIVSCLASSDVRAQPLSNEETLQGAINRAKDCLKKTLSALAIGLEAGVVCLQEKIYLCHWGVIIDRFQNSYFTNGPLILLPNDYKAALLEGQNLEDIMHLHTGVESLGAKKGAIGVFTQNRLNREQVMTQMVKVLIGQYRHYQSESV